MQKKITENDNFPFYKAYHKKNYIVSHDCRKIVVVEETRSKCEFHNTNEKEIVKYKIDGGLINIETENKCDFAIYTEDDILFFIELKGSDYDKALTQLKSTIEKLLITPKIKSKSTNALVVTTRTPKIVSSNAKKLEKWFCSKSINIEHKNSPLIKIL